MPYIYVQQIRVYTVNLTHLLQNIRILPKDKLTVPTIRLNKVSKFLGNVDAASSSHATCNVVK